MQKNYLKYEKLVDKISLILTKIQNNSEEFENIFTQLFEKDFQSQFENINKIKNGSLKGLIISVKDLFDVKGYKTKGGTKFLDPNICLEDSICISLIRAAGGFLIGHTNMTEIAYSGLGINPHYGTPLNPVYKGAIPGGSTSGGAVSIALNISDIAIGTDTGGSTRIPAAFTGITGFKPTQDTISRDGVLVLSSSLDSIGLMAKNVELCKLGFEVMKSKVGIKTVNLSDKKPDLIIPSNFGFEDIEPEIKSSFDYAKHKLAKNGFNIIEMHIPMLDLYKKVPLWQFAAVESQTEYFDAYKEKKSLIDPNILRRMDRANTVLAVEYNLLLNMRDNLIREFNNFLSNNFLLLPTVTIYPPLLVDCKNEPYYDKVNLICLRNTSLANYMNGCSISLPFSNNDNKSPIGIMLNGITNNDKELLNISANLESVLSK